MTVTTGLDRLVSESSSLSGQRVGLLTNHTGMTAALERGVDALYRAGLNLVVLIGPEHGLSGTAQAGASEGSGMDAATGLPVVDAYHLGSAVEAALAAHRVEAVVVDLQDVGVRYWTYTWTMYDAMVAAARLDIELVVLDRPNPLGGLRAEGPTLDPAFASLVGRIPLVQRHGLTMGELARLFNRDTIPNDAGRAARLSVVPLTGWNRGDSWAVTGLPWVMPSPNLPTVDSVWAFAATGLIEGTNVSEGRGTTRPFELFGAPYTDGRLLPALTELKLPGVLFREADFCPTFHKYAKQTVHGAQLYVSDYDAYRPVFTGLAIIQTFGRLYPDDFLVLPPRKEAEDNNTAFPLDRLWGSDRLRFALTNNCASSGVDKLDEWCAEEVRDPRDCYGEGVILYPNSYSGVSDPSAEARLGP